MPRVLPFRGVHFNFNRVPLGRALCPPYDVIPPDLAPRLRRLPANTIHIELPAGKTDARYRRAAGVWRKWRSSGVLTQDQAPAYYVVEQRFFLNGKTMRRAGILAALGLGRDSVRRVVRHEKTLSKPKKDRLKLLAALGVNTSPIFAVYPDSGARLRRILSAVVRQRPMSGGRTLNGVTVRVWRVDEPLIVRRIAAAMAAKTFLIADGHHRLEVARRNGRDSILCYACAEEDPGLVVLPTHRVLDAADDIRDSLRKLCDLAPMPSLQVLTRALARHSSTCAFGVVSERADSLAVPRKETLKGVRSGLGVEWLAKRLLKPVDPQRIRYTHEAAEAASWARRDGGSAILVKLVGVKDIRRAVMRTGLLPQKSTYFYPKVEAGIVFKEA